MPPSPLRALDCRILTFEMKRYDKLWCHRVQHQTATRQRRRSWRLEGDNTFTNVAPEGFNNNLSSDKEGGNWLEYEGTFRAVAYLCRWVHPRSLQTRAPYVQVILGQMFSPSFRHLKKPKHKSIKRGVFMNINTYTFIYIYIHRIWCVGYLDLRRLDVHVHEKFRQLQPTTSSPRQNKDRLHELEQFAVFCCFYSRAQHSIAR